MLRNFFIYMNYRELFKLFIIINDYLLTNYCAQNLATRKVSGLSRKPHAKAPNAVSA